MREFFRFFLASCLGTLVALGILIILLAGIGSIMAISSGSGTKVRDNQVLHLTLNEMIPEKTGNVQNPEFTLTPKVQLGVRDIAETIKFAASDNRIKGIFMDIDYASPGQASSLVIKRALDSFQLSGKWIYAYGDGFSEGGYFLASAADSIFLNPNGSLDFRGFAAFVPFLTGFMDKIGLDFEIYYAGDFKSATEPFRLNEMSDQNRLQMREYLNEIYTLYLNNVGESRKMDASTLRQLADQFVIRYPEDALDNGMIDGIMHREDVYARISARAGLEEGKRPAFLSIENYFEEAKPSKNYSAKEKIALVYAEGEINDSEDEANGIIAGDRYAKILRKIREDEKIKAVVLRVNSPGGSVLASSKILAELKGIQDAGKKLVVSMGDYAASGGYYIAAHADHIYAEPNTLTGSIGVFSMIPSLDRMLNDKLGIRFDTVGTGAYSTRFSVFFDWDEREDTIMQAYTDHQYEKFLQIVAEGRDMSKENVHEIAQGRIWSGSKALELGLVDELGDLSQALEKAKELAGLESYRLVEYPYIKDPITLLMEQLTGDQDLTNTMSKSIISKEFGELAPHIELLLRLKEQKGVQARLPFVFQYR